MKKYAIGVAGFAGAGKDTVVNHLVANHEFAQVAFADPLRSFAWAINPIVGFQLDSDGVYVPFRYQDALDEVGYRDAKTVYPEVRGLLQRIGTEGVRETFWDSFWVDMAQRTADDAGGRVAFSDMRFPNETQVCKYTVWVSRAGLSSEDAHVSETALLDWDFDYVLTNDGSYEDLYRQIDEMVERFESA